MHINYDLLLYYWGIEYFNIYRLDSIHFHFKCLTVSQNFALYNENKGQVENIFCGKSTLCHKVLSIKFNL